MRRRTLATLFAAPLLALSLVSCSPDGTQPSPIDTPSEASTPKPSESEPGRVAYQEPETVDGEVARVSFEIADGVPTATSTAVDAIAAGRSLVVEGQCIGGDSVEFELWRAEPGEDSGTTLLAGEIACDVPSEHGFSHSLDYEGVVQMMLTRTDSVTQAWVVARQE